MYKESNYKIRGGWALLYPILYQIRFVALTLAIIYINGNVVVQVLIITMFTILVITLLGNAHPMKDVKANYTLIANEAVILLVTDLLLFCSDPSIGVDNQFLLGLSIVFILAMSLIFSQGSLMLASCK